MISHGNLSFNISYFYCTWIPSVVLETNWHQRWPIIFNLWPNTSNPSIFFPAVRADRMRGGRNKFGPMYKRDRARKLQMMRQRQLAAQTLRGSLGEGGMYGNQPGASPFPNIHIKQEIQIPQVSSLTSSPDSSPSPIAVALGQVSGADVACLKIFLGCG